MKNKDEKSKKEVLLSEIEATRKRLVQLEIELHKESKIVEAPIEFSNLIDSTLLKVIDFHNDPKRILSKGKLQLTMNVL